MSVYVKLLTLAVATLLTVFLFPRVIRYCGKTVGNNVRSKSEARRSLLLSRAKEEEQKAGYKPDPKNLKGDVDHDWEGIVGFFHPFW